MRLFICSTRTATLTNARRIISNVAPRQIERDEIAQAKGNREQHEGLIQARYGYAMEQAKREVEEWLGRM